MRRVIRHAVIQPADQSIRYIPLTRNLNAIVDAADYAWLSQWTWWAVKPHADHYFYAATKIIKNRPIKMHRLILDAPASAQVDHINQNGLDNRRSNLRLATPSENAQNRKISVTNTSGFKGVSWDKHTKKWRVKIRKNGLRLDLGFYSTPEEAGEVYRLATLAWHGKFARVK